jgi:hypothetical protein
MRPNGIRQPVVGVVDVHDRRVEDPEAYVAGAVDEAGAAALARAVLTGSPRALLRDGAVGPSVVIDSSLS